MQFGHGASVVEPSELTGILETEIGGDSPAFDVMKSAVRHIDPALETRVQRAAAEDTRLDGDGQPSMAVSFTPDTPAAEIREFARETFGPLITDEEIDVFVDRATEGNDTVAKPTLMDVYPIYATMMDRLMALASRRDSTIDTIRRYRRAKAASCRRAADCPDSFSAGEVRSAIRRARERGSSVMPEIEEGTYTVVFDTLSGEGGIIDAEIGDIWIIDEANDRHIRLSVVGLGPGFTIGGDASTQRARVHLSSVEDMEGVTLQFEGDFVAGFGAGAQYNAPLTFRLLKGDFSDTYFSGGPGAGWQQGLSLVVSYSWFSKVYSEDESPLIW